MRALSELSADAKQRLVERRKAACHLFCKLLGFKQESWRQRDAFMAERACISWKEMQDVRIARRNLGEEAFKRLAAELDRRAQFMDLESLTIKGLTKTRKKG